MNQGYVTVRVNAQDEHLTAGDALVVAEGGFYRASGPSSVDAAIVTFGDDVLTLYRPPDGEPLVRDIRTTLLRQTTRLSVRKDHRTEFTAQLRALERELQEQRPRYQQAARSLLTLLLVALGRSTITDRADSGRTGSILADVLAEIDRGYAHPLSLRQVASAVSHSPGHLARVVRSLTGHSVGELIEQTRMDRARAALLDSDLTIEAVAATVGYRDASYLPRK